MDSIETSKYQSPADYFKILFRRKALWIIPTYVGLVGGIVFCQLTPPIWQSSTTILVEEEKIINPLIQNLAVSTSAAQRMSSIREILLGWNSLVDLAKKLELDKRIRNQRDYEQMIMALRANTLVQMRPPNLIILSYYGRSPMETQKVAQTFSDILIERNMKSQTKETDVAITFIKEQLDIYKRKIKEGEIADLQDKLKELLADSTEEHPMVKEYREKIAIATRELNSGEYEVKGQSQSLSEAQKKALESELDQVFKKQADAGPIGGSNMDITGSQPEANTSIYKLLLMDKVGSVAAKDANVNTGIYNMLLQRLETAKITQRLETSREGTRYTVLDPARLPLTPVRPNKLIIILAGLFLGLGAGLGLAFLREFMDQSIMDIEDAKAQLKLPILGAIPRITTAEEVASERTRTVTITVIASVLGVALVAVAFFIALFRDVPHV